MLKMNNDKTFGQKIRRLRKSLSLTQTEVSNLVGLSENTLTRLEKGQVTPRFETLELLSYAYKADVVDLFLKSRQDFPIFDILAEADDAIFYWDVPKLKNCLEKFKESLSSNPKLAQDYSDDLKKLELFLRAAQLVIKKAPKELELAEMTDELSLFIRRNLVKAPNGKVDLSRSDNWVLRLLIVLATLYGRLENYDLSNEIIDAVQETLLLRVDLDNSFPSLLLSSMLTQIYQDIRLENNAKAENACLKCLEHVTPGEFSRQLFMVYYFMGIAQFKQNKTSAQKSFLYAFIILEIHQKQDLIANLKIFLKENLGILVDYEECFKIIDDPSFSAPQSER